MERLKQRFKEGLTPNPTLTFYEWAEKYFHLPPGSTSKGLINMQLVPYLKEPLENMSWTSPVLKEFWMKGIQIAASTGGEIVQQATVDYYPVPVACYYGTDDMAIEYVKRRVEPAFNDNPKLKGKLKDGYDKKGKSTLALKMFPGGWLKFMGSVSERNFREFSAAIILMDDCDSFIRDVGGTANRKGQGSPIKLATNRTSGRQGKYKIWVQGSPTDLATSLIWHEYKKTDKRKYHVKCPFCKHPQEIDFFRIKVDRDDEGKWLNEPALICEVCKERITEDHKFDMMQIKNGARWVATAKTNKPLIVGRHMSSAYSLLGYTWTDMLEDFFEASAELKKGNINDMVTFHNTKLGLPWDENQTEKKIDHKKLFRKRETYVVHEDAVIIMAGVDIQGNRIEILVLGFSESGHIYCIEHKIIGGNTTIEYGLPGSPYNDLEDFLKTTYKNTWGGDQPILHTCLDMGYHSITASPFLRDTEILEITGIFGSKSTVRTKTFISDPIKNKYNTKQREVNVNEGKTTLNNKLGLGLVHFSKHPSFTKDFMFQLTVETFDPKTGRWGNKSRSRNEGTDLLNYGFAAYHIYSNSGKIDWESFITWNKKGCKINSSSSKTFKIISEGIKV